MLIGLLGYIGSGKGTAGTILADRGYTPVSFASRVKDVVSAIFGWDRALLEGDTEESRVFRETPDSYWSGVWGRPYTPREALQKMGTEAGRTAFHKDLWVKALIRDLKPTQNYVITDVRFPNEIKAIYESGGVLIEISRGTPPEWYGEAYETNRMDAWSGLKPHLTNYPGVHYSEWAWVGHPLVRNRVGNDTTVEALRTILLRTVEFLENPPSSSLLQSNRV